MKSVFPVVSYRNNTNVNILLIQRAPLFNIQTEKCINSPSLSKKAKNTPPKNGILTDQSILENSEILINNGVTIDTANA